MQPNNKPEFITLDSRLTIQRGNIYTNRLKPQTEDLQYRFIAFAVFVLLVVLTVEEITVEKEYFKIIRVIVLAVFLAPLFKRIYQTLFVRTWKTIIPLKDIKHVTTKPLENGLETELTLHLQNGRKKFYTFRNAEGQLEPFVNAVSEGATSSAHLSL